MNIYKITNLINGKIYIGQETKYDPKYLGSGKVIKNAVKKYGKENFKKEILEECKTKEKLNKQEIYWISFYNSTNKIIGYNLTKGGEGGDTLSGLEKVDYKKYCDNMSKIINNRNSKLTKEEKKKYGNLGEKNPMYGSHRVGELNPMYGKEGACKGKLWINNKEKEIYVRPEDIDSYISKGYILGRLKLECEYCNKLFTKPNYGNHLRLCKIKSLERIGDINKYVSE